jgi:hypothetical protein
VRWLRPPRRREPQPHSHATPTADLVWWEKGRPVRGEGEGGRHRGRNMGGGGAQT